MKRIKELMNTVGKNSANSEDRNSIKFIHHPQYFNNPIIDQETIERINPDFFLDQTDAAFNELKSLPAGVMKETIEAKRSVLCNQLAAVTKKLSDVILDNQPSYAKELKRTQELQQSLQKAFIICTRGRSYLNSACDANSQMNLGLLSNYKKQEQLKQLLQALHTIKTLQSTDVRLKELLQDEDYDEAVQLCLECIQVSSNYSQYNCIKDLSSKLQDTLEQIEEQIDVALSQTCHYFDDVIYARLQASYKLLGKLQVAADQLLMHYTTCINNSSLQLVTMFVSSEKQEQIVNNFTKICSTISRDSYISCLVALCRRMWAVMCCYHQTITWHQQQQDDEDDDDDVIEARHYVMKRLRHGRHRVWSDVQSRIKICFESADLSHFKYQQFIQILDLIKRFIKTGNDFCSFLDDDSDDDVIKSTSGRGLIESLQQQTLFYFRTHHQISVDDLIMFIDNESWQPCPVTSSFNLLEMQEFSFLRHQHEVNDQVTSSCAADDDDVIHENYFEIFTSEKTPFEDFIQTESRDDKNDVTADDDVISSDDDVEVGDYVEAEDLEIENLKMKSSKSETSMTSSSSSRGCPVVTNSVLQVLRLCGNYLKMGNTLKAISSEVVKRVCQLFEIYFYSVVICFTTKERRVKCNRERLESTIRRIRQSLFLHNEGTMTSLREPLMNAMVNLDDEKSLFAFQERIVAVQSLSWLADQLTELKDKLELMTSSNQQSPFLTHFYSQTIALSSDVTWVVMHEVICRMNFFHKISQLMIKVDWNVADIMTQHNSYVDTLLADLTSFKTRFHQVVTLFPIPKNIQTCVWHQCILFSNHLFVEGFAAAKCCSNEGRALMQLDYQQFLNKLEKITNIRPIPNREFVESYIKAFYFIESDLENWIKSHPEYSTNQIAALLQCSNSFLSNSSNSNSVLSPISKNTKQKVLSLIEDLANRK